MSETSKPSLKSFLSTRLDPGTVVIELTPTGPKVSRSRANLPTSATAPAEPASDQPPVMAHVSGLAHGIQPAPEAADLPVTLHLDTRPSGQPANPPAPQPVLAGPVVVRLGGLLLRLR
jgi:hypothetical protein